MMELIIGKFDGMEEMAGIKLIDGSVGSTMCLSISILAGTKDIFPIFELLSTKP